MTEASSPSDSQVKWIPTAKIPTLGQKAIVYASFTALGNRVDVESVGLSTAGVTFVRKGQPVTIPWGELIPSKMQYGKGYLILKAKEGTPRRGGPWVVNQEQGRAILSDANWPNPVYAGVIVAKWLS